MIIEISSEDKAKDKHKSVGKDQGENICNFKAKLPAIISNDNDKIEPKKSNCLHC